MALQDKRQKSYLDALQVCDEAELTPLFSFQDWKGTTEMIEGKCTNIRYRVRCNKCGYEYETYFKRIAPGRKSYTSCPNCGRGQKGKEASFLSAVKDASSNGFTLLVSKDEWKGKSEKYKVRCNKCGLEFITSMKTGHYNNCPYCNESSSSYNQLLKLSKICEDNKLQLLSTQYVPGLQDGRPSYRVKCKLCGTEFDARFIGHNVTNCPTCCSRKQRSNRERLMSALLDDLNIEHFNNYRLLSVKKEGSHNNLELDIYIPSKGIAFEFNGQAYHNASGSLYHKDRNYHKSKTELFLEEGIKVYHIWDFTADSLCESIIRSKVGYTHRVYARKCKIVEVTQQVAKEFFSRCHVDGYVRSTIILGLVFNNKLMCCITFMNRALQASKTSAWEIGRFASELNTTVVGGYSKLLNRGIKLLKERGCTELVSYCNRDLSPDYTQTFYYKQGFTFLGDSGPLLWYWASKSVDLGKIKIVRGEKYARQLFQKQKLLNIYKMIGLPVSENSTEKSLAEGLGLYQVFNSGNWKFIKRIE